MLPLGSNTLEDTKGSKSVRANQEDQDHVEQAGYSLKTSASTLFSELAADAAKLAELREAKKEELRRRREDIRDEEENWGIE